MAFRFHVFNCCLKANTASTFQFGYWKRGTHALVLSPTVARAQEQQEGEQRFFVTFHSCCSQAHPNGSNNSLKNLPYLIYTYLYLGYTYTQGT